MQGEGIRVIKNRDIPKLTQIRHIMQSVLSAEKRKLWQEDRLSSITGMSTGMPRKKGGVPAGYDAAFAELEELTKSHSDMIQSYINQLRRAEDIINGISSPSMRAFVVMKYVDDVSDAAIRRELGMSEYAFKRARDAIEQSESMQAVNWREKYYIDENDQNT